MVGIGRKKVDEMIWLKRDGGKVRESGGGVVSQVRVTVAVDGFKIAISLSL